MHERFATRIEEGLESLERRLRSARHRRSTAAALERQIGRLLGRNTRAAGRFDVALVDDPSERLRPAPRCGRSGRSGTSGRAISEGCYVLRTNVSDWTPEALWQTYIQLTEAEAAFRIQKSDLSIRPDLAPEGRPREGSHPRLLPRLRPVEDPRDSGRSGRARQQPEDDPRTSSPPSRAPTSSCRPPRSLP